VLKTASMLMIERFTARLGLVRVVGVVTIVGVVADLATLGCGVLGPCETGDCWGSVPCSVSPEGSCPTNIGCALEAACVCDPTVATCVQGESSECSNARDASVKCGEMAGCVWKRAACTGRALCSQFRTQAACRQYITCSWVQNCT
jgi:hypothetical protein